MLGEQGQAAFTILNEGALQVQFDISSGGQVSVHSYNAALWCPCRAVACKDVSAELLPAIVMLQDNILQQRFCRPTAFKGVFTELQPVTVFLQSCCLQWYCCRDIFCSGVSAEL